jgi:hypothetical protein
MTEADLDAVDRLKAAWTDRLVRVRPPAPPHLTRFETAVGRVVTVSYSGRAVVDFGDGAWTDVADFDWVLEEVADEAARKKYDPTANSAQPRPGRQA